MTLNRFFLAAVAFMAAASGVRSHADSFTDNVFERISVQGHQTNLLGQASSASEGVIGDAEIADRTLAHSGEVLEFIPGMVVTQHSGSGKAAKVSGSIGKPKAV